MKIVVLVKEVPDTYGDRVLSLETGLANRAASERVLDEIAERALEVAISHADSHPGTEVVAMSMGPAEVPGSLRKALALGADGAVHILDDGLVGADLGLTAQVLAAAIERGGFDLVIAGNQSTDGMAGVIPTMVAELLDAPQLTSLSGVEITDTRVSGTRTTDYGIGTISAPLPAVVSITEAFPAARVANFKGIMSAKKKPVDTVSLADLGIDADDPAVPRSIMVTVAARPARVAGVRIIDDGNAAEKLADFLVQNKLA